MADGKRSLFYGWVLLPICLINILIGNGISSSFSVIFVELISEFGLSRAEMSGIYSLYIFIFFCGGSLVGALLDLVGPRILIPFGSALAGAGLLASSQVSSPYPLYLTYGLVTALGSCFISWVPNSVIISNWFMRRRGMAVGIVMCGNGLGILIFIPLTQVLIEWAGWRGAFVLVGAIAVAVVAPLNAVFQRTRPEEVGLTPDGEPLISGGEKPDQAAPPRVPPRPWTLADAARQKSFWLICLANLCNPFLTFSLTLHQVALVVGRGFEPMEVASTLGLVGVFAMAGRVAGGALSDRIGREWAYSLFLGCAGLAVFSLFFLNPDRPWVLSLYVVLAGLGMGVGGAMFPPMLADLFPGPSLGRIMGIASIFAGFGSGLGSWLVGALYDLTGSYAWGQVSLILAVAGAITFVWIAAPRKASRGF